MSAWRLVIVESPFAGDVNANLAYVRACMHDCIVRGESPYASHALLTQRGVLDDNVPEQRALGIDAGFAWGAVADAVVFYIDRGVSRGMLGGIDRAIAAGKPIEFRTLEGFDRDNEVTVQVIADHLRAKYDRAAKNFVRESGEVVRLVERFAVSGGTP